MFKYFTYQIEPRKRYELRGYRKGEVKSYEFKTFTHKLFNPIWDLFYNSQGKKIIKPGIITENLSPLGLSYWIMDDGSLHRDNYMVLHTQGYSKVETKILSEELNKNFNFSSKVSLTRKYNKFYPLIIIPAQNSLLLYKLTHTYIKFGMEYKIPKIKLVDDIV